MRGVSQIKIRPYDKRELFNKNKEITVNTAVVNFQISIHHVELALGLLEHTSNTVYK